MELKTDWYNQNLEVIKPISKEIGAILYITKDFDLLNKELDYLREKHPEGLIIDVFNGWCDTTIKVYAKCDYIKEHQEYLDYINK